MTTPVSKEREMGLHVTGLKLGYEPLLTFVLKSYFMNFITYLKQFMKGWDIGLQFILVPKDL